MNDFSSPRLRFSGGTLDQIEGNTEIVNSGDNLQSAYDQLKSSANDGSMGALSVTNWRTLLLSPGTYTIATKLTLDTDFVAIASISGDTTGTILKGGINEDCLVEQTCDTLSLEGFTISVDDVWQAAEVAMGGFWITDGVDNTLSTYDKMVFKQTVLTTAGNGSINVFPCSAVNKTNFSGTWTDCESNWLGFRMTSDINGTDTIFNPLMINCHGIARYNDGADDIVTGAVGCFAGDGVGPLQNGSPGQGNTGSIMQGEYHNCTSGTQAFSGCASWTMPIGTDAKFFDCHAGVNSFVLQNTNAGYFYGCTAAGNSFAADGSAFLTKSIFSGTAINCTLGSEAGFSTGKIGGFGSLSKDGMQGTLRNCVLEKISTKMQALGAHIDGCWIKQFGEDTDCIELKDSNCVIYNSTLIADGTGKSIEGTFNVVSAHNRMNTGLGTSTNLVTTPYDVIDAAIK